MLDQIPAEIIESILSYLPTASAITSVSLTNKKLHEVVKDGENAIFHRFVERQFPTIDSAGPWREAAFKLTSRSRAWDKRAFIARECVPPRGEGTDGGRIFREQAMTRQTFGFMPVIDSYETGETGDDREVLAWGAGGRLRVRISKRKSVQWSSLCFAEDSNPHTDILDLRLLRPQQNRNRFGESVFIRRANRELALLNGMPEQDQWVTTSTYTVRPDVAIECVDVSETADPLLAVCNSASIQLFPIHTSQAQSRPASVVPIAEDATKHRMRCAKFISSSQIAVAPQFLTGLQAAPIEVFNVAESNLVTTPLHSVENLVMNKPIPGRVTGRISANVLAKVDAGQANSGNQGDLLLSGWSDGLVRLYDLRAGQSPLREFSDPVDNGQIFSLLPIGHERFLAGSHQNGCLKTFDMRMDGRVYDYTRVGSSSAPQHRRSSFTPKALSRPSRDINIFLALSVHHGNRQWRPLPGRHNNVRLPRYNGSIYSLSSPSAMSPTVYVGIENHVIQLDSINADDWVANRGGIRNGSNDRPILNLSCYERPRDGHESTDTVLLRKQNDMAKARQWTEAEEGWDQRWYLEQQRTRKGMAASWRAGRPG